MKILIIASHYKPGYKAGGPIQSVNNLAKLLSLDFSIYVLTKSNDLGNKVKYNNIKENIWLDFEGHKVKYLDINYFNQKSIIDNYKELKPDYIYFNSFFSSLTYNFIFNNYFSRINSKIIIAPRGELDPGALKIKSFKKLFFINLIKSFLVNNIQFHATTTLEQKNIKNIINKDSIIAENVPNLITLKPIKELKYVNETNLVFISRISPKKNLAYCIDVLSKVNVEGQITLDIIGPLEDKEYWKIIERKIGEVHNNIKINYIGEIPNHELIRKTSKYHFLFFPTQAENYGHIIYESLSYGIPVILSDQTPWKEDNNGVFVRKLEEEESFINLIQKLHLLNNDAYSLLSNDAFEFARNKVDKNKLISSYKNLFNANNKK